MRKKHFTRQVGLILAEETYNQLIEETNKEEVSVSEWVRQAIENGLNQGKDPSSRPAKHLDNSLTFGGKEKTR